MAPTTDTATAPSADEIRQAFGVLRRASNHPRARAALSVLEHDLRPGGAGVKDERQGPDNRGKSFKERVAALLADDDNSARDEAHSPNEGQGAVTAQKGN